MGNLSSRERFAITILLLLMGIFLIHRVTRAEAVPVRRSLDGLPLQLGQWKGSDEPLEERILKAVGVDDYVNRVYQDSSGYSLQLYIGYYKSQRAGDTIHSPKNCLPGGGWVPISSGEVGFSPRPNERLVANEYVIEKGRDSNLVIYWYQFGGRVVASEYWAKVWMVMDALQRNRTDGALVRIWVPMAGRDESARAHALQFARLVYPRLAEFVPN